MRFEPKSEREIAAAGLLPAGEYPFEVLTAEDKQSAAGNDMVEMNVRVYDLDGAGHNVFDYLVATEKSAFKIRHFAEATGLLPNYETGNLPADAMVGRSGYCKLVIRKDAKGQYPDKNTIADYLKPKSAAEPVARNGSTPAAATRPPAQRPVEDDDVPF